MSQLRASDLRPGDLLLSMGSSWKSRLIRILDGGHYSHAGLWDGERVIMSGERGIERHSLYSCDVYRFQHQGIPLGDGELDPQVLLEQARGYLEVPNRYGYTGLYLVGLLMIMRRLAHPAWRRMLVELLGGLLLSKIKEAIDRHFPSGVVAVTCSELVTRIFCDARRVTGAPFDILVELEGRHEWPAWPPVGGRFERLMQETEDALSQVDPHLPQAIARARFAAQSSPNEIVVAGGPLAPACFVSPGDLEHSSSFVKVGQVVVERGARTALTAPRSGEAPSAGKAPARRAGKP